MTEYLKWWPVVVSVLLTALTLGVYRAKLTDVINDVKVLKKDTEDGKIERSEMRVDIDYIKERDKEFVNALNRNTEAYHELKTAISVLESKQGS